VNSKKLKITAGWYWPDELKEVSNKVAFAKSLGFNAMIWCSGTQDKEFINACKKNSILPFKIMEPLSKKYGTRLQVLTHEEKTIDQKHTLHQYGGEPAKGKQDILSKKLLCPTDDKIIKNVNDEVKRIIKLGYKGICWDFIGYRNLKSCHCMTCTDKIKLLSKDKPINLAAFYESQLIELYNRLETEIKNIDKKIISACHIHPTYLPNPFYASKIKIDHCAVTCSWFFLPHWKKSKINNHIETTTSFSSGIPMIAYYQSGPMSSHTKSKKQIDFEFKILHKYKKKGLMICELGSIYGQDHLIKKIQKLLK